MDGKNDKFLIVETVSGEVALADARAVQLQSAALAKRSGQKFVAFVYFNLSHAFAGFDKLCAPVGKTFSLKEVATVAGLSYANAHQWVKEGVISASVRSASGQGKGKELVFSYHDARCAATLGALHRAGCKRETLKRAWNLLQGSKANTKAGKKTAEEVEA